MIRARSALFRQAQDFFHSHLLGIYDWEQVEHSRPQAIDRPESARERADQAWFRGQTHDKIEMRFGPFDLTVLGPFEDDAHPRGLITVQRGRDSLNGPLDPTTWGQVAEFIKTHDQEEADYGSEAGSDWGR